MSLLHGDREDLSQVQVKKLFFFLVTISILLFCPDLFAGTGDTELSAAKEGLMDLVVGDFAGIVTIGSLAMGVIACMAKLNTYAIVTPFGVALVAKYGPAAVDGIVGAII